MTPTVYVWLLYQETEEVPFLLNSFHCKERKDNLINFQCNLTTNNLGQGTLFAESFYGISLIVLLFLIFKLSVESWEIRKLGRESNFFPCFFSLFTVPFAPLSIYSQDFQKLLGVTHGSY